MTYYYHQHHDYYYTRAAPSASGGPGIYRIIRAGRFIISATTAQYYTAGSRGAGGGRMKLGEFSRRTALAALGARRRAGGRGGRAAAPLELRSSLAWHAS